MKVDSTTYDVALEQARAEFLRMTGPHPLPLDKAFEIRTQLRSKFDAKADSLPPDQAAWKTLFLAWEDHLFEIAPDTMAEVTELEAKRDALVNLEAAMKAKAAVTRHDFGFRVAAGFLIVGILVGWVRSATDLSAIAVHGVVFWCAGVLLSIFALDSPHVQSVVAIWLNKIGLKLPAHWLYARALRVDRSAE